MKGFSDIGLGILSWKTYYTLRNTLSSCQKNGLFDLVGEKLIFFQETMARDLELARQYELPYIKSETNVGIAYAFKTLIETMQSDFIIFLENDFELIEPKIEVIRVLGLAKNYLQKQRADVFKLRHRYDYGDPEDAVANYRQGNELTDHRYAAVHLYDNPEQLYPAEIAKTNEGVYLMSSCHTNWSNNPAIFRRHWARENLLKRLDSVSKPPLPDLEKEINGKWWQEQNFTIAMERGLFKHNRLVG